MGFAAIIPDVDIAAIKAKTDLITVERLKGLYSMSFWSDVNAKITVGTAADLDFPQVVVSGLPSDVTITRVYAVLFARAIKDTSGSNNYLSGASKTIRLMKSDGTSWGTNDIVALTFPDEALYCVASTKENGFVTVGNADLDSKVDEDATYLFKACEAAGSRGDAIGALAASLELYDVQVGLMVEFER